MQFYISNGKRLEVSIGNAFYAKISIPLQVSTDITFPMETVRNIYISFPMEIVKGNTPVFYTAFLLFKQIDTYKYMITFIYI